MSVISNTPPYDYKWAQDYPELGNGPVSTEPFLSPTYYESERDAVFRSSWLNVGRVEDIPEAGDFYVKDIPVCNVSILIVRDTNGTIKAFHNVCKHRANKLVWKNAGNSSSFSCRYHGWNYALDGKLRFVPDEQRFYDFNKESNCLLSIHLEIWNGFIFINLEDEPAQSLTVYLGDLAGRLNDFPFEDLTAHFCYRSLVKANWKNVIYAFNELYHLGFVHAETGLTSMVGPENRYGRIIWLALGEKHQTISVYGNPNHKMTPVEGLGARFGPMFSQGAVGGGAGLNPGEAELWGVDINVCFPNFFIDTFHGSYFTYHFWPTSHNETLFEYRHYTHRPENAAHRFTNEFSRIWLREVLLEDIFCVEQTQQGMETRAVTEIHLGDSEVAVRHHVKTVDDRVNLYRSQGKVK